MRIKINWNLSISLVFLILTFLFQSCKSLNENDNKFIGEWYFSYTNDQREITFLNKKVDDVFKLNKNGTWEFGESNGKWGNSEKKIQPNEKVNFPYSLGFKKTSISTTTNDKLTMTNAEILDLDGTQSLSLSISYKYIGEGIINTENGAKYTPNKEYNETVVYYFIKDKGATGKVEEYFKSEEYKKTLKKIDGCFFYNPSYIFTPGCDTSFATSMIIANLILDDTSKRNEYKVAIEYAIKSGKSNSNQMQVLDIINQLQNK